MRKITVQAGPMAGFAAHSATEGADIRVVQQGFCFADTPEFYLFINQIEEEFLAPAGILGDQLTKFIVVQHADASADVFIDIEFIVEGVVTRDVEAGEPVLVSDISKIETCRIEGISIRPDDSVVCAIKMGWKYGLYFDFRRKTSEQEVWQQLGQLCNTLHTDRSIANIQRRVLRDRKPHIITEGKTDWKHLEAARRVLEPTLVLGYAQSEAPFGDAELLRLCRRIAEFGPENRSKVIAIFDRDNPDIVRDLARQGNIDSYQVWGNNVYSLALPVPVHRQSCPHVCIEMLYSDDDLVRRDIHGRRLYFEDELERATTPQGSFERHRPRESGRQQGQARKLFSGRARLVLDDNGRQVAMTKSDFANHVYDQDTGFDDIDFSGFRKTFDLIKAILAIDAVLPS
ncbi:hypothetical protein [Actinocorallia aurantiaca]|uniref:Uncharacterized protein n=1 Tax=Actinocorallia aurantiaca TaxID=46204 RepID=A0ABN3UUE6_9ACTN